jgi:hypothetical protein
MVIVVPVMARPLPALLLIWIVHVGAIRSTITALYRSPVRTASATTADSSLKKRPLLSQPSRLGSSTGQDDSTAPILGDL